MLPTGSAPSSNEEKAPLLPPARMLPGAQTDVDSSLLVPAVLLPGGGIQGDDFEQVLLTAPLPTPSSALQPPPGLAIAGAGPDVEEFEEVVLTAPLLPMPIGHSVQPPVTHLHRSSRLRHSRMRSSLAGQSALGTTTGTGLGSVVPGRLGRESVILGSSSLGRQSVILGSSSLGSSSAGAAGKPQGFRQRLKGLKKETNELCSLALPLSAAYLLDNSLQLVETFFVGHMGATELAAGSLAISLCNITGWALGFGLLTALDTLAAQSFGAGKLKEVGTLAQRALLVVTVYALPTMVVWAYMEPILLGLQQEPEVAALAAKFVWWSIPGLIPSLWFEVLRRYMQAIDVVTPVMLVILISLPSLAVLIFALSIYAEWGFIGVPIAVSIVQAARLVMLIAYVIVAQPHADTWPGWTRGMFTKIGQYLKLAIPGALMSCMEVTGFEVVTIFAGWLGTLKLAVHSALLSTYNITYMIPTGFALGVTTRVGHLLGANKPQRAKNAYRIGLGICVSVQIITVLLLATAKHQIAFLFTSDPEVVSLYEKYIYLLCIIVLLDGIQIVGGGCLRGLGRQRLGMIANFFSFYCVGIPSGFVMAFVFDKGVMGLWTGIAICDTLSAVVFSTVIFLLTDWVKTAAEVLGAYYKSTVTILRGSMVPGARGSSLGLRASMAGKLPRLPAQLPQEPLNFGAAQAKLEAPVNPANV